MQPESRADARRYLGMPRTASKGGIMSYSFAGLLISVIFILYILASLRTIPLKTTSDFAITLGGLAVLVVLLVASAIAFRRRVRLLGVLGAMNSGPKETRQQ